MEQSHLQQSWRVLSKRWLAGQTHAQQHNLHIEQNPAGHLLAWWYCAGSDGSIVTKSHAMAVLLASGIAGESTKLTDDQVGVLEQQYGALDRCLPTGHSFGELSLADTKLARRNATILAAEPASLIRIDKGLYRRTLYEMQVPA